MNWFMSLFSAYRQKKEEEEGSAVIAVALQPNSAQTKN
jgi:hypothetical protein